MTMTPSRLGEELAVLEPFVRAGLLDAPCVHLAGFVARAVPEVAPEVLLGAAFAARGPGVGHVCVEVARLADSVVVDRREATPANLPWPEPDAWAAALADSPAVRGPSTPPGEVVRPLVFDGTRLYLERYWRYEEQVAADLRARAAGCGPAAGADPRPAYGDPSQDAAVALGLRSGLTVIAGGPGTGKTVTVSRLLAACHEAAFAAGRQLSVTLAAPTGKAAARMQSAVHETARSAGISAAVAQAMRETTAGTLHRLLGARGDGRTGFDREHPLPYDLVVVDEMSMVSLPLMARLLAATRPEARLVLVGDPFQLASVEAGAVLADVIGPDGPRPAQGPLAGCIVTLERNYRFSAEAPLGRLARQIREGDCEAALETLAGSDPAQLRWVKSDDEAGLAEQRKAAAGHALEVVRRARGGDPAGALALSFGLKVLCATRFGPLGVAGWSAAMEAYLRSRLPGSVGGRGYVGRPVIITRNDYFHNLFNGDVGVVCEDGDGRPMAAFEDAAGGLRTLALSQLGDIDTWWASTVHKSQGSEFERVIVSLPPAPSPILTRELLYTAVTRARGQVTVVAEEASLREAISRRVARASGLGGKLWH